MIKKITQGYIGIITLLQKNLIADTSVRFIKQYIILLYYYLCFTISWYKAELLMSIIKVGHFLNTYCYALLISNFLLQFLFFVYRINTIYLEHEPIIMRFLDLSPQISVILDLFLFCFLPSFCVFLCIFRKPIMFFAIFFDRMQYTFRFFVYIARIELYHCQKFLSGFIVYICIM